MGVFIAPADLTPFKTIDVAKATEMVADAEAQAILVAPCLPSLIVAPVDETFDAAALRLSKVAAVKSILRGAILRWDDAGTGVVQQTQVGPFGQSIDTRQVRRGMFWPSEIEQLQSVCASGEKGKAFGLDVIGSGTVHTPWCNLMFGALYCSCGADIGGGVPIYEYGDPV